MGISILHAWIRVLELFLHVAYRLTVKKGYHEYKPAEREKISKEEKLIKEKLEQGLGLKVDRPNRSVGSGNTNDGNTARRFLQDPFWTAEVTSNFLILFLHKQ